MGESIAEVRRAVMDGLKADLTDSLLLRKKRPAQEGTPYRPPNRTDNQDLIEAPTKVIFGSGENAREFLLYPKPHLEADEWRMATLQILNVARPILMKDLSLAGSDEIANTGEAIMNLANLFVAGAIPAIVEQVFNWETSLPREVILHDLEATDTQMAAAFMACLQLAFPFYSTLKEVSRLIQGSQPQAPETPKAETPQAQTPQG